MPQASPHPWRTGPVGVPGDDGDGLDDALVEVLALAVTDGGRDAGDRALGRLARAAAAALGAARCTIATWDDDSPSTPGDQRWWSWPDAPGPGAAPDPGPGAAPDAPGPDPSAVPGPPRPGDVHLERAGVTLGYLRLLPPPGPASLDRLATLTAVAVLLLGHEATRGRLDGLRHARLHARAALTEERRLAATGLDLARRALERDLHDGMQSDLLATTTQLAILEHVLAERTPPDEGGTSPTPPDTSPTQPDTSSTPPGTGGPLVPAPAAAATVLRRRAEALGDRLAALAEGLLPDSVHRDGLQAALRSDLPELPPPGQVRVVVTPAADGRRWPQEVEAVAYFVALEAVTNAGKHAPGADVDVVVDSEARGLVLAVRDDGPGFDTAPPGAFRAMRERAALVAASLQVEAAPGRGTTVTLVAPY